MRSEETIGMSGASTEERRYASRRPGRLNVTRVRQVHQITPHMTRITFGGDDLSEFLSNGTDQHVALYFYDADVELPRPFTADAARALLPVARPRLRRYTIRQHHPERGEVDMDFVLHGADQLASGWAETVRPGDESIWFGPSPAYPLDPEAPWYLFLGDETALPAIAATLAELPATARARVLIEVADAAEEQPLPTAADVDVDWLHRNGRPAGSLLHEAALALALPPGAGRVWGAAERGVVKSLRGHYVRDRGLDRAHTHLTAYWTRGETQDSEV
ncbi:siderophore-interacting protein [Streptomyces sp. 796.1]|uniref:siderophore-interacting protein n=1 Tax=Streptomyces sp. 796.1 TaxID=3163029 RepID=UPI0039C9DE2C